MTINDNPIAATADGRVLYDNAHTVVCVLVPQEPGLLAVVRNNEPGKGLVGLPGGYHMRGETWQEAGARECLEETGRILDPYKIHLHSFHTDEYHNNLVIARYIGSEHIDPNWVRPAEVQCVVQVRTPRYFDWAFPRHQAAAEWFLNNL